MKKIWITKNIQDLIAEVGEKDLVQSRSKITSIMHVPIHMALQWQ